MISGFRPWSGRGFPAAHCSCGLSGFFARGRAAAAALRRVRVGDRVWAGQAAATGGPQAAVSRFSQSCSWCQPAGRCSVMWPRPARREALRETTATQWPVIGPPGPQARRNTAGTPRPGGRAAGRTRLPRRPRAAAEAGPGGRPCRGSRPRRPASRCHPAAAPPPPRRAAPSGPAGSRSRSRAGPPGGHGRSWLAAL